MSALYFRMVKKKRKTGKKRKIVKHSRKPSKKSKVSKTKKLIRLALSRKKKK